LSTKAKQQTSLVSSSNLL